MRSRSACLAKGAAGRGMRMMRLLLLSRVLVREKVVNGSLTRTVYNTVAFRAMVLVNAEEGNRRKEGCFVSIPQNRPCMMRALQSCLLGCPVCGGMTVLYASFSPVLNTILAYVLRYRRHDCRCI